MNILVMTPESSSWVEVMALKMAGPAWLTKTKYIMYSTKRIVNYWESNLDPRSEVKGCHWEIGMGFLISQNQQRKLEIKTVCCKIWTSESVILPITTVIWCMIIVRNLLRIFRRKYSAPQILKTLMYFILDRATIDNSFLLLQSEQRCFHDVQMSWNIQ